MAGVLQVSQFLPDLAKICVSFKTPVANLPLVLRVFFYLARFCPTHHALLVATVSKLFQMIPDQTADKRRKSKSRSKAMDELILASVRKAIDLCIELKGVGDLGDQIISRSKVQARLIPWVSNFSADTKLQLVRLLGSFQTLPHDYAQILSRDDQMCSFAFSARFLVLARSEFTSTINEILERPSSGALSLMQVTFARTAGITVAHFFHGSCAHKVATRPARCNASYRPGRLPQFPKHKYLLSKASDSISL
jgi:hypothetical protein